MEHDRPDLFFLEQLERVLATERVKVSDDAHIYLAGMLCRPATVANHSTQDIADEMAARFITAMHREDARTLRLIGDQALMLRGFWWQYAERLHSHGVSAEYYEDIGQRAYLLVRQKLFDELADQFKALTHALALLWSHTHVHTEADLFMLYRFWLHTKSPYAHEILKRHNFRIDETPS